jgi:hypothetical protein
VQKSDLYALIPQNVKAWKIVRNAFSTSEPNGVRWTIFTLWPPQLTPRPLVSKRRAAVQASDAVWILWWRVCFQIPLSGNETIPVNSINYLFCWVNYYDNS